nr:S8 family peptidase [uncultured Carboxylicivirga sp.]
MAKHPLILFPKPTISESESRLPFIPSVHYPSRDRQIERVVPMFRELNKAFESRRVEIQDSTVGIDPEQVIVIKTIGSVAEFAKAVAKIQGLEWMGEVDIEGISPDEDFFSKKDENKDLSGTLYMLMSNQRALEEMLSLWNRIKDEPDLNFRSGKFKGYAKFKEVFWHLKEVRRWGVEDRLLETGIIDIWKENLRYDPLASIKFEIELWDRNNDGKNRESYERVALLVVELGGKILDYCELKEIGYHALLVELPAKTIEEIIIDPDIELIRSDYIMFFRPLAQMIADKSIEDDSVSGGIKVNELGPLPKKEPLVAILDGYPYSNHDVLKERLIIDDPEEYGKAYLASERMHGTAMSSLIIHGDLEKSNYSLDSFVYLRPIMQPNHKSSPIVEYIPDSVLTLDLINRSIRRILEGEGGEPPKAPSVKVINFSIGISSIHFNRLMSPLARLLDYLSEKYKLLIVVSSGNHYKEIDIDLSEEEFFSYTKEEREGYILKKLIEDSRNRRLISPAESINAITVGGLHYDSSDFVSNKYRINPFESVLFSPTNPIGGGFNRSIKPDIVYESGKQLYSYNFAMNGNSSKLKIVSNLAPPGLKVACPDGTGISNKVGYITGSSNAAALISRASILCIEELRNVVDGQFSVDELNQYEAVMTKALIVHGAEWGEVGEVLMAHLESLGNKSTIKKNISRLIGYGIPDIDRSLNCTDQKATIISFGKIKQDEGHLFELPLPPSLSSTTTKRRLTVTLAYIAPINHKSIKYRHSNVWFSVEGGKIISSRFESDKDAVRRGTIQHEIFEESTAYPFSDGEVLEIKVNCKNDGKKDKNTEILYGLVVSLEVSEATNLMIYEEVRTRISNQIKIKQQA